MFKIYKSEWEMGQICDSPELPNKDYDLYRKFESRILDS